MVYESKKLGSKLDPKVPWSLLNTSPKIQFQT
jgi:hypothetical protein